MNGPLASAMVANANNNNNNNNINDNKFNGNQNDLNEGNANANVMDMNMIMPGRSLDFPVEATTVRNSKTGDKHVYFRKKRKTPDFEVTKLTLGRDLLRSLCIRSFLILAGKPGQGSQGWLKV